MDFQAYIFFRKTWLIFLFYFDQTSPLEREMLIMMRRNSSSVVRQGSDWVVALTLKLPWENMLINSTHTLKDKDTVEIHTGQCNTYISRYILQSTKTWAGHRGRQRRFSSWYEGEEINWMWNKFANHRKTLGKKEYWIWHGYVSSAIYKFLCQRLWRTPGC